MNILRDLLLDSRDGEWGQGQPGDHSVEMSVIRGTDFDLVRIGDTSGVPVRYLRPQHAQRKALQDWDIIIETAGGSKDRPTGRTLLLTPSKLRKFERPVTCASFARFLRIDPCRAHPPFIFWLLQDEYANRRILKFHTQHTGVARFQFTTFCDTHRFSLPSPPEQRRIADILSSYDDLIEVNQRRIAILEEMARRLFEEWFVRPVGRLPFPGDRPLGDLPAGWHVVELAEVASLTMGQSPPSTAYSESGGGLPFHQGVSDFDGLFHRNRLFCHSDDHTRIAQAGDILFSVRAPVARLALALDRLVLGRGLAAVTPAAGMGSYLYFHLRSAFPRPDMIGNGAIYKAVNKDDVRGIPILRPADEIMRNFDVFGSATLDQIRVLHSANTRLRAARDLLLPKLISGEIDMSAAPTPDDIAKDAA